MVSALFHSVLGNVWIVFLIVLFFLGSIFVHELGHFLAARRHGLKIERFSIGFGPVIWSRRGKDGVDYRLSWIPIGGYVALPQLADLRGVEGESTVDAAELPPISYRAKMIVFVAGASFNVLFAFALACIVSAVGLPEASDSFGNTTIGAVSRTVELANGKEMPSPAMQAGLRAGDIVRSIDGKAVHDWNDIASLVVLSGTRDSQGRPEAHFQVDRAGQSLDIAVHPLLSGDDHSRQVGIGSAFTPIIHSVTPGSAADKAGFQANDELERFDGNPATSFSPFIEYLHDHAGKPVAVEVLRAGRPAALTMTPIAGPNGLFGFASITSPTRTAHPSPFTLVWTPVVQTWRTLESLLNPHSDVGLSKMSGFIGIVHIYHEEAEAGILPIMLLTILINVNLAIINLLPIPVLDGGQMLFATIGWVRGRSLPTNFIMATQSVFMVLILIMMVYISYFDVLRLMRS